MIAAALEHASTHPLARAFAIQEALPDVSSPNIVVGQGVSGRIDGREWRIGNADFVGGGAVADDSTSTHVFLGVEGNAVAWFELEDELRPDAKTTLNILRQRGAEILPALTGHEVTALYAGLRPASEFKDYQISAHSDRAYISVGGIRSTGLSSALGTARYVHGLCAKLIDRTPLPAPRWPQVPNLAEAGARDWQCAGNGGIVCHCERVTRRDIETALSGPLPAASLAGLKRRTRVTMGRCQGNYCVAPLADITRDRLDQPISGDTDG